MKAPLVLTTGEPAGIGPDLVIQLAQAGLAAVVLADPTLLEDRARQLGQPLQLNEWRDGQPVTATPGQLQVLPVSLRAPVEAGRPDPANAPHVLEQLRTAAEGCLSGRFSAVVTGPLHKGVINDAGLPFTGHTEFFQALAGVDQVVMMLATEGLRVALATTHLPLREVADAITPDRLERVLTILDDSLRRRFGIETPRILVAGLNPHAGEQGHLGREELEIIEPTLAQLRKQGLNLTGPLPADTLFTPRWLTEADAVLVMYHDQGLPVLKYTGFGRAVNITLGLPFVRTSVDHGTALELAGTGRADTGSLAYALQVAREMSDGTQA